MSDWGKGVINDIGWGQGANNDIGWGSIYDKSYAGETLLKSDLNIDAFIIEVDTTKAGTPSDQFQFTGAQGDYDVVAKQNDIVVATFNDLSGQETITLPSSGIYVLEVSAKEVNGFTGIRFANAGDKLKITKNLQWGIFNDSRQMLFLGCSNLTEIASDIQWINTTTNGDRMFTNCNLTSLPSEMTLANLTNGRQMFTNCNLTSLPSEITLANLSNGDRMFLNCNLTSLPSEMTLANLTNGNQMFRNCNLTSLPSEMTLANLTNGNQMFENNTINTARYSTLLVDMEDLNSNANVPFNGGLSKYNASGETARNLLIANQNWSFTDAGPA
jgi:hypothetical protein